MYEFEVEHVLGGHPLPKTLKMYCEFNPEPGCAPAAGFDVPTFKRIFFKFAPEYKSKWLIFLEWNPESLTYRGVWRPDAIKAQSEELSAEVKRYLAERKYPFNNPNSKPARKVALSEVTNSNGIDTLLNSQNCQKKTKDRFSNSSGPPTHKEL